MKTNLIKFFLGLAIIGITASASAQYPAPQLPAGARAMQLWTDHPAAPSGEPNVDYQRLQEMRRQAEIRAIQARIEAERQRQAQLQALKEQQCRPTDVPVKPAFTYPKVEIPVKPYTGPTIRRDNSSEYERNQWRQNQHVFEPTYGHGH